MTYNFDEIIDRRHTNALNTDGFRGYIFHAGPEKVFAFKDEEFVRMWVADMEFGVAPEILDALRARIVPLVRRIQAEGKPIRTDFLSRPCPISQQEAFSRYLLELEGLKRRSS